MNGFESVVAKLCSLSIRDYINPYAYLEWPDRFEIGEEWYVSPELLSVYGTPLYDRLSTEEQKRLSFYDAINFFSLNIHGEKSLIEGLAQRLYRRGNDTVSPYIHHFLDEENKHMLYFGGFCMRYAGKVYPDRKMVFSREYAPGEEDVLFFAKVLIFEELVDVYNKRMAKDERLAAIARQINFLHHRDESRHLAFGRLHLKNLFEKHSPSWPAETREGVREYLKNYIVTTWKEYYNPAVYRDAGFGSPFDIQEEALQSDITRQHRKQISAGCIRFLMETGMLAEVPEL
jgi:hypothetical protein